MELLLKLLTVLLWSSTKFLVGFAIALAAGFNLVELLIGTVGGGMLGVLFYMYLWQFILQVVRKYFPKKIRPIKFNKTKRFIVKVILKYELYGLAFLTPLLLTIPIGTILAVSLEPNKWRIKWFMFVSLMGWALFLYALKSLVGLDLPHLLDNYLI